MYAKILEMIIILKRQQSTTLKYYNTFYIELKYIFQYYFKIEYRRKAHAKYTLCDLTRLLVKCVCNGSFVGLIFTVL